MREVRAHFFFLASPLAAASFLVTALTTPTATVCRMSRTAKRPSGGYWEKVSTHMALDGTICTIAASPVLIIFGLSSSFFPLRRSILVCSALNLTAMCAVWQSSTGAYPAWISPGWLSTMTCAVKSSHWTGGSFLVSPHTKPRLMSFTDSPLTLKPTLSPGTACCSASWCISTDLHSVVTPVGANVTDMPGLSMPVSTRPTGTVPIPPILYTSWRGRRRGLSVGLFGGSMLSSAWRRHGPLYHLLSGWPSPTGSNKLSPVQPEIGILGTFSGL
mmetsp:Transcript_21959/g.44652  ORF Transcript_21959/g.44652 Transcript_21959/m.44652 type:complete len:273 (+) Transcript_21959:53-871(+)